jgi:hypothetical protein
LTFGKRQFEAGRKWGRVEMQHQLRTLLDVPANPPAEQ